MLKPGDQAPEFSLSATGGQVVRLSDFVGRKTLVLYFYPKDDTPGCTAESCSFRDQYSDFVDAGAEVVGVSSDSIGSHEKFSGRYKLPFKLLSDEGGTVRAKYGAKGVLFGLVPGRVTFVIDRQGIIRYVFDSMFKAHDHVKNALTLVKELEATTATV